MQLTLLRHAKTAPGSPTLSDAERPLEEAGRRALALIASVLAEAVPDLVLCSSALRTRQTLEEIRPTLTTARRGAPPTIIVEDALYLAGAEELLRRLRRVPEETAHILFIGHNPGIHDLTLGLLKPAQRATLAAGFPTAGLARLSVGRWPELKLECAELMRWATPGSLSRG